MTRHLIFQFWPRLRWYPRFNYLFSNPRAFIFLFLFLGEWEWGSSRVIQFYIEDISRFFLGNQCRRLFTCTLSIILCGINNGFPSQSESFLTVSAAVAIRVGINSKIRRWWHSSKMKHMGRKRKTQDGIFLFQIKIRFWFPTPPPLFRFALRWNALGLPRLHALSFYPLVFHFITCNSLSNVATFFFCALAFLRRLQEVVGRSARDHWLAGPRARVELQAAIDVSGWSW